MVMIFGTDKKVNFIDKYINKGFLVNRNRAG